MSLINGWSKEEKSMESRLNKMGIITLDGKAKEISGKNCKNCKNYRKFIEDYMGDCSSTERTVMNNDACGLFERKEDEHGDNQNVS